MDKTTKLANQVRNKLKSMDVENKKVAAEGKNANNSRIRVTQVKEIDRSY